MSRNRAEKNRLPLEILRNMRRGAPQYRLNVIAPRTNAGAPQADKNSLNNWFRNNVDPGGGDWLDINLSATGNNPFTHCGCSSVVTERDATRFLRRLFTLASLTPPADFDAYTRKQKAAYFLSQAAAVKAAIGVAVTVSDFGPASGFDALLAQEGLQRT